MPGVESQLQSHIGISKNVGLTAAQLRSAAERGQPEASRRIRTAVEQSEATAKR
jgi:4-carboxymuconolactone decarboxylase